MFSLKKSILSNFKYSKCCNFVSGSLKGHSISRANNLTLLNALQNREDIQKMFGTVEMEKPYIVPLVSIASQLYSGLSTICEAILLVRDRSLFEFRKIFDVGSINPTFCITYNSLVIFVQGCLNQINSAETLKERLVVAGVPIELIIISTYSFAAFWTMQHVLSFSLTKATISLIQNIGGENIPLIRIHEIYYKVVFGVFNGGTLKLNGESEMCNLQYKVKPTMTFELWHNGYKDVDAIVQEVMNLIETVDDELNRDEAHCIIKSLIDGEKTDYADSGLTGSKLQKLQNYLGIMNNLNKAGSIAKILVFGIINEKNCEPIARIMDGFYTVICAANIPFKLAKDVQHEQLTLMEFTYAFPIISNRTDCHPSEMEIYIGTLIDVNLSKFIAYGWSSIIGSTVSLNNEILLENLEFGEGVLNNLLMIESEFNKPYGDLLRDSFIMLTGVITDRLGTEVNGLPKGLNDYNPNCDVWYVGDTTTGNFGQLVERSILSDGLETDRLASDADLFDIDKYLTRGKINADIDRGESENNRDNTIKVSNSESKNTSNISKGVIDNDTSNNSNELVIDNTNESYVKKAEEEIVYDQLFEGKESKITEKEIGSNEESTSRRTKLKPKRGFGDSNVKRGINNTKDIRYLNSNKMCIFTGSSFNTLAMKNLKGSNERIRLGGTKEDMCNDINVINGELNTMYNMDFKIGVNNKIGKENNDKQKSNFKMKLKYSNSLLKQMLNYVRSPTSIRKIMKAINLNYKDKRLELRMMMNESRNIRSPTLNLLFNKIISG